MDNKNITPVNSHTTMGVTQEQYANTQNYLNNLRIKNGKPVDNTPFTKTKYDEVQEFKDKKIRPRQVAEGSPEGQDDRTTLKGLKYGLYGGAALSGTAGAVMAGAPLIAASFASGVGAAVTTLGKIGLQYAKSMGSSSLAGLGAYGYITGGLQENAIENSTNEDLLKADIVKNSKLTPSNIVNPNSSWGGYSKHYSGAHKPEEFPDADNIREENLQSARAVKNFGSTLLIGEALGIPIGAASRGIANLINKIPKFSEHVISGEKAVDSIFKGIGLGFMYHGSGEIKKGIADQNLDQTLQGTTSMMFGALPFAPNSANTASGAFLENNPINALLRSANKTTTVSKPNIIPKSEIISKFKGSTAQTNLPVRANNSINLQSLYKPSSEQNGAKFLERLGLSSAPKALEATPVAPSTTPTKVDPAPNTVVIPKEVPELPVKPEVKPSAPETIVEKPGKTVVDVPELPLTPEIAPIPEPVIPEIPKSVPPPNLEPVKIPQEIPIPKPVLPPKPLTPAPKPQPIKKPKPEIVPPEPEVKPVPKRVEPAAPKTEPVEPLPLKQPKPEPAAQPKPEPAQKLQIEPQGGFEAEPEPLFRGQPEIKPEGGSGGGVDIPPDAPPIKPPPGENPAPKQPKKTKEKTPNRGGLPFPFFGAPPAVKDLPELSAQSSGVPTHSAPSFEKTNLNIYYITEMGM